MDNPEKMISKHKQMLMIGALILVIALVAWIFFNRPSPEPSPEGYTLSIEDSPILGDKDAPITIYEFSDFSCPFCQGAEGANQEAVSYLQSRYPGWEAPVPKIKEEYVNNGKVKIVFKYFPGHGTAGAAHAVALGLKEQNNDLFWEFAEKAFASSETSDLAKMKELAGSLGADMDKLNSYIESGAYQTALGADVKMGEENGVQGTPMFFIVKGDVVKVLSGAQAFSTFESTIENLL